jgi:DNA-binding NtrC family response regulator
MSEVHDPLDGLDDSKQLDTILGALLQRAARARGGRTPGLRDWVALTQAWRIAQALRDARGNRSAAARALGIGRRTLYSKMEQLGIVPSWGLHAESPERRAG